jgi:uncharacterized protein (TIGR00299 family) protein
MLAYFDCFCGISGDMTLGALIDSGVPVQWLKDHLSRIPLAEFDIRVSPVSRHGIQAAAVQVETTDNQSSRNYTDIRTLIESCPLPERVKSTSLNIFDRLAQVEARIHNCPLDQVHFHEVGGIDAIIDIVGTALGLDYLGIKKIIASPITLGSGFATCSHGKLPVPVPATMALLTGVPVKGSGIPHELVTPTGAAIITSLTQRYEPMPEMVIAKVGYGAGQRDIKDRPNLLRLILAADAEISADISAGMQEDQVSIVETCIDDMNPELFGYLMDRLFADGALDVYWIPVHMKKNRPGTMLQVICKEDAKSVIMERILSETTTLGVRHYSAHRRLLWREQLEIKTRFGIIPVKRVTDPGGNIRHVPEYEICRKIALKKNIPLRLVYDTIVREAGNEDDQ